MPSVAPFTTGFTTLRPMVIAEASKAQPLFMYHFKLLFDAQLSKLTAVFQLVTVYIAIWACLLRVFSPSVTALGGGLGLTCLIRLTIGVTTAILLVLVLLTTFADGL